MPPCCSRANKSASIHGYSTIEIRRVKLPGRFAFGRDSGHGRAGLRLDNLRFEGFYRNADLPQKRARSNFLMAYVVTDACTKDFACVEECSTAAIAPMACDPAAGTALITAIVHRFARRMRSSRSMNCPRTRRSLPRRARLISTSTCLRLENPLCSPSRMQLFRSRRSRSRRCCCAADSGRCCGRRRCCRFRIGRSGRWSRGF